MGELVDTTSLIESQAMHDFIIIGCLSSLIKA